jgi:amino acid transporter
MLPRAFARLHPRFGSPTAAILLVTAVSVGAPFLGRQALLWLVNAGAFATVVAYLLVAISFLAIRRKHPDLDRPYRVPRPRLVGVLAVLVTVLFVLLYLPGTPASPRGQEWGIVLAWAVLGFVFAAARRFSPRMTSGERRRRILGEYADRL